MNKLQIILLGLLITIIASCGKDPEDAGYSEPIAVLNPATNPATTIKGAAINYKVAFTNDEYIDSVQIFLQIDSLGKGYDESKDSMIKKVVYPVGAQSNLQNIESSVMPWIFPNVGKPIYLTFWLRSKNRFYKKNVKLEVL